MIKKIITLTVLLDKILSLHLHTILNEAENMDTIKEYSFDVVENLNEDHTIVNGEQVVIINAFVFDNGVDILEF